MNLLRSLNTIASKNKIWLLIIFLAAVIIIPIFIENKYIMHVLISASIYVVLTLSLNLVTGYAGQFALGHIAFFGIGAYSTALLMLTFNLPFLLCMLISSIITGIAGFVLGLPTLRLRGDYLAIVTLGFGEIFRMICVNWSQVTSGPRGIPGIPPISILGHVFTTKHEYYYFILLIVILSVFFMSRLTKGGFGMSMLTVQEDEIAAASIGINPVKYKVLAFVIGAMMASIVGSYYACYISFISPESFVYNGSITIVSMLVLGGMGSIPGSILGASALIIIPEFLRSFSEYRMLIYGALMILMMIFRPNGLWGAEKRIKNIYKLEARGVRDGNNS